MSSALPPLSAVPAGVPVPTAATEQARHPANPRDGGLRLLPWLVCAAALAAALLATGNFPVGAFYDDGIYVVLGKALATGHGYRYLNLPGEPTATHFPPGYPAFLAVLWKLAPRFPENLAVFRFANAALLAAAAGGAYAFARRRLGLSPAVSAVTAAVGTISIPLLTVTVVLLSEPLFLALALPVLLLCERAVEEGSARRAALAGIFAGVVTLVRSIGIGIIPATVLLLLLRRRWAAAGACALGGLAIVLPWQLFAAAHAAEVPALFTGQYGAYTAWAFAPLREQGPGFLAEVLARNAVDTMQMLRDVFTPRLPLIAGVSLLLVAAPVAALGAWVLARRAPVTALFILSYLAIVAVWPFRPTRFLWGIWPFVWLLLASGASVVWGWRPPRLPARVARVALLAGTVAAMVGHEVYLVRGLSRGLYQTSFGKSLDTMIPLVQWVSTNTAPTDVIVTTQDVFFYLYTGRQALPAKEFTAVEHLAPREAARDTEVLREITGMPGVRYLLVNGGPTAIAAERLLRATPPALSLVAVHDSGAAVFIPVNR